jgi:hypothetical protein
MTVIRIIITDNADPWLVKMFLAYANDRSFYGKAVVEDRRHV